MRRGFTLIELVVTLAITTVLFVMLATAYVQYNNINKESISNQKFILLQQKITDILQEDDRLIASTVTPDGILELGSYSIDDLIYKVTIDSNGNMSDNYNDYLVINEEDKDIAQKQMVFLDITKDDAIVSGNNRYLLLITEREGVTKQGFKFPYKIFTIVDLGEVFYRNWKRNMKSTNRLLAKSFLRMILKPANHGYIKNLTITDREDPTTQSIISMITGSKNIDIAYEIWDRNKYNIKVSNINLYKTMKERIEISIENINKIVKNIEDWALIQARIAAYDTLNGDNLDKDYFVTCTSEAACTIEGRYIIDRTRTLVTDTNDPVTELEKSTNNGFVVCSTSNDGKSCTGTDSYVINSDCIDQYSINDSDLFRITKALPIDRAGQEGSTYNYKFGSAVMNSLLSITKKSKNEFGYPIYFTNSNEFIVENLSDFFVTGGLDEYKEELNVPLENRESNPPYIAKMVTIFPFYLGGHYIDDGTENRVLTFNDGWGVYSITIFAHIF